MKTTLILSFLLLLFSCNKSVEVSATNPNSSTTTFILTAKNQINERYVILIDLSTDFEGSIKKSSLTGLSIKFNTISNIEIDNMISKTIDLINAKDSRTNNKKLSVFIEEQLRMVSGYSNTSSLSTDKVLELITFGKAEIAFLDTKVKKDWLNSFVQFITLTNSAFAQQPKPMNVVVDETARGITNSVNNCLVNIGTGQQCDQDAVDFAKAGTILPNALNRVSDALKDGYNPQSPTSASDVYNKFKNPPKTNPFGGWGEPHLITSDGVNYDFQGKGEFIAVKSSTDNFEIQARQVDSDRWTAPGLVTVNTAIAINTGQGQNIISVYSNPNRIFINRTERKLTDKISLNGGDKIEIVNSSTIMITSSQNDEIKINLRDTYLDYQVQLATNRQGKVSGLLGNFDRISDNDILSANGEKIDLSSYNSLYKTFADSWRVTNSYFNYDAGKNTDSYTDRNYPRQIVSIESFSMAERTQAEQTCKRLGVINEPALSSCILDLAVTKNESFAVSALQIDEATNVSNSFSFTDFTSANIFKNGRDRKSVV